MRDRYPKFNPESFSTNATLSSAGLVSSRVVQSFSAFSHQLLLSRRSRRRRASLGLGCAIALMLPLLSPAVLSPSQTQAVAQSSGAIQLKASRVEANSTTGVVTAVGSVRIDYPSRQIFATAAQAQYYSQEQRIVLSGNVDVIQEGNTLQAETVTYLIEEGRFVATPGADSQVEAVYLLPDDTDVGSVTDAPASGPVAPAPPSLPSPPAELPADLSSLNVDN